MAAASSDAPAPSAAESSTSSTTTATTVVVPDARWVPRGFAGTTEQPLTVAVVTRGVYWPVEVSTEGSGDTVELSSLSKPMGKSSHPSLFAEGEAIARRASETVRLPRSSQYCLDVAGIPGAAGTLVIVCSKEGYKVASGFAAEGSIARIGLPHGGMVRVFRLNMDDTPTHLQILRIPLTTRFGDVDFELPDGSRRWATVRADLLDRLWDSFVCCLARNPTCVKCERQADGSVTESKLGPIASLFREGVWCRVVPEAPPAAPLRGTTLSIGGGVRTVTVDTDPNATFGDVKADVCAALGYPMSEVVLCGYHGEIVPEGKVLSKYYSIGVTLFYKVLLDALEGFDLAEERPRTSAATRGRKEETEGETGARSAPAASDPAASDPTASDPAAGGGGSGGGGGAGSAEHGGAGAPAATPVPRFLPWKPRTDSSQAIERDFTKGVDLTDLSVFVVTP